MTSAQTHIMHQLQTNGYAEGYAFSTLTRHANAFIELCGLANTRAAKCGQGVVLVTDNQLPQGFKWVAFKGKMTKAVKVA